MDIEKIMLRNETASTNLTIIAVAASLLLAAVTYFIIDFATAERGQFRDLNMILKIPLYIYLEKVDLVFCPLTTNDYSPFTIRIN
jgi:hypothetical protein